MRQVPIWVLLISFFLLLDSANSAVEEEVKNSLINFLAKLNGSTTGLPDPSFGWNNATDPCQDKWKGVYCNRRNSSLLTRIILNENSLSGVFDSGSLCNVQPVAESLVVIRLDQNNIGGQVSADIGKCRSLTHLLLGQNQLSGDLPESLANLNNLKKLDISHNNFAGNLPADLSSISGLKVFLAQYNELTGEIPKFDFSNLDQFNVSFNRLNGPIPEVKGTYPESSSLTGNPDLCGPSLQKPCPSPPPVQNSTNTGDGNDKKGPKKDTILMYSGYALLALFLIAFITYKLLKRKKKVEKGGDTENKVASIDDNSLSKPNAESSEQKPEVSRTEFFANSSESAPVSTSLIVLTSPVVNGLKFEDLLKAQAELLGRGKHGSLYKVILDDGMVLAVKRIKDWAISSNEFKHRMQRVFQASHPNVLPPLAFYSSLQEKLLVYEFQKNGSLFRFLHEPQMRQSFDWVSRLSVAARIADALAFMHRELSNDGIAHGNLKTTNILVNNNMEPCISEYGVVSNDQDATSLANAGESDAFKADIYGFGVILLELLTGKLVQNNGSDLTTWVHSVVREEWTAEVFDKVLIAEGASEQRLVNLLQVAIKCVDRSPEARPSMNQVAQMINTIKEEEERSLASEP